MHQETVMTGTEGLDRAIGGGFPRGGLILVAGNAGTGKTVFSAQFLYRGAVDCGENGVYVSFAENSEVFHKNMKAFGFDFERLEREGRFRYLDMVAVREESISSVLKTIVEETHRLDAKRLVIDSFSAVAQAFKKPFDARIVIHTVLSRITRQTGCTTLMIVEVPFGTERIGLGMEEFVADGVLLFRADELDGRLFRDIMVKKMRGAEILEDKIPFTLKNGLKAFPSFEVRLPKKKERFRPLPDSATKFSTGSSELDSLLDGGYPKGSTVLLEMGRNVSILQYHLILSPTVWNFLAKGACVIVTPSSGVDYRLIKKRAAESGLPSDTIERLLRVCAFRSVTTPKDPHVVEFEGKSIEEDYERYLKIAAEIRQQTGRPILHILGVDTLLAYYGRTDTMKILNLSVTTIREHGALGIFLLKPTYFGISGPLNAIADVHLKIVREHGASLLYGLKPRTMLHFVEMDVSKGYPLPELTPVI
ncbi:hypothetical protein CW712_00850 [Candidatus Bathyarchaeota archaeon]|nr:MAG: hypothetical protein CW712_00850 [Candidatus Bathyarchaeota archaeon]